MQASPLPACVRPELLRHMRQKADEAIGRGPADQRSAPRWMPDATILNARIGKAIDE